MSTPHEALQAAVTAMGTQTLLAQHLTTLLEGHPNSKLCGRVIHQGHIATWLTRGQGAPPDMCRLIAAITGVEDHQLRPDVFYEVSPL